MFWFVVFAVLSVSPSSVVADPGCDLHQLLCSRTFSLQYVAHHICVWRDGKLSVRCECRSGLSTSFYLPSPCPLPVLNLSCFGGLCKFQVGWLVGLGEGVEENVRNASVCKCLFNSFRLNDCNRKTFCS